MLGRKIKKLKNWLQNRYNLQLFRLRLVEDRQKTSLYRAVLISHELSATGAPLMLLAAAEAILADGGSVRGLAYMDGPLREKFEKLGIPVFYHPGFRDNARLLNEFGGDCAYAVANTAVAYPAVSLLKGPRVLWWIHEAQVIEKDYIARFRQKKFRPDLEQTLRQAGKLAVVSDYAREIVAKYNPKVEVIHPAVADVAKEQGLQPKQPAEKIRFAMLGAVCEIKGQDVLLKAVRLLPAAYRAQAEFHIAGRRDGAFAEVLAAESGDLPEVVWEESRSRDNLWDFYRENDVIMVASRDESFSLVALEACMASRPLIISSNAGAKFLVRPSENGGIFTSGSAESLSESISEIIDRRRDLSEMGRISRREYEKWGTTAAFRKSFLMQLKK